MNNANRRAVLVAACFSAAAISIPRLAAAPSPATSSGTVLLPVVMVRATPGQMPYPHPALATRVWRAVETMVQAYPPATLYPGYAPEMGGPSPATVDANLDAACYNFPDLPDVFGPGAHRRACYQWVADYLGLYHAVRAQRSADADDLAWAQRYFDAALDGMAEFVFGPGDSPSGVSYRDTRAAAYQNTLRAVDIAITGDLLHRQGALTPAQQAYAEELLSGVARAWFAAVWRTGLHPSHGITLTTRTALEAPAHSLAGLPVTASVAHTFHWDADKGNTPAEEVAWMGAGAMLASRVPGSRLPDGEVLYRAGQHYVDFAVAYDRPDPIHGGVVRTLNAESEGGPYGQRQYWLENHAPDIPSIPYLASTWHFIGTSLFASATGEQAVWPGLVPDDEAWWLLWHSAEQTLRGPDGTLLVDLTPGGGIGFAVDAFPDWWMPCGQGQAGRLYVRAGERPGGTGFYVSEIGHAAGADLLVIGWPLLRLAADRADAEIYRLWERRMIRVLDEYETRPIDLSWAECKVAPYVSPNPGYHWARVVASMMFPYLGLSGYSVEAWHSTP